MSTVSSGPNGRAQGGRFAPGNSFARGNPNARRQHELRAALLEAATDADVQEVGRTLAGLAKGGDVQAAKVWLDFVCGRPPAAVELTGADGGPLVGIDWARLQAALLDALGPFGEARVAVALRLKELADAGRDAPPDGDGD